MADLISEGLITLREASILPELPKRGVNMWRYYATRGVAGVKLETLPLGKTRYTTKPAIARFMERVAAARNPAPAKPTTAKAASTSHDRASSYLDRIMGDK